jgi:hypothetical protein
MTNFDRQAKETIQKLAQTNAWHEVKVYDYFTLLGIQGKGGNNFYWFRIYNGSNEIFFDHCYNWGNGKVSRSSAKHFTAFNTLERLIK